MASVHADEDAAGAARDCARAGRVPVHGRWAEDFGWDFVVVGERSRAFASEVERSAGGAGAGIGACDFRELHSSARCGTGGATRGTAAGGVDARLLFGQRVDRGGSRAEDGVAILAGFGSGAPRYVRDAAWGVSRRYCRGDVG